MTLPSDDIYKSENGDTWRLIRDAVSGRVLVRHEANPSSGGHVAEVEVEEFLSRGGSGPEYAAMRRLLGTPTRDAGTQTASSSRSAVLPLAADARLVPDPQR